MLQGSTNEKIANAVRVILADNEPGDRIISFSDLRDFCKSRYKIDEETTRHWLAGEQFAKNVEVGFVGAICYLYINKDY